MSENGKLFDVGYLTFTCSSTASVTTSGDGTPTYSHSFSGNTLWVPNIVDLLEGITFTGTSSFDGTSGTYSVNYTGPGTGVGGYTVSGATYLATISISIRFPGYKMYGTGNYHIVKWSDPEVSINGGAWVAQNNMTGDNEQSGFSYGANYVPVHAIPLEVAGSCGQGRNLPSWTSDPCDPDAGLPIAYVNDVGSTITAGWTFTDDSGAQTIPVFLEVENGPSVPGATCHFSLSTSGVVSASNTGSASIVCVAKRDYSFDYSERQDNLTMTVIRTCTPPDRESGEPYETVLTGVLSDCEQPCGLPDGPGFRDEYVTIDKGEAQAGAIRLFANPAKALTRLGQQGYSCLLLRLAMPAVYGTSVRTCGAVTATQNFLKYPQSDPFLEHVGDTPGDVEDFLRDIRCGVTATKSKWDRTTYSYETPPGPCQCPPSGVTFDPCPVGWTVGISCGFELTNKPSVIKEESVSYSFPTTVSTFSGTDEHAEPLARYSATWANPWHRILHYRQAWEIDGSPFTDLEYWGPLRTGHNYNAALPGGGGPKTRFHHVASPMERDNGNTPYQDVFLAGHRWVGASRFDIESATIPADVQLSTTIPSVWTPKENSGTPECTVTLGANVVLSGFTGATAQVDVSLAQWSQRPFLQLVLAKRALVGWSATNVTTIEVLLVGADGVETSLGTTTGWKNITAGGQDEYAGSWAQDFGVGVVTDSPTDEEPEGRSATTMSDPIELTAFSLGKGRQYRALRFKVTPTNTANPVTLDWPKFELHNTHPKIFNENGHVSILVWPDGPAVRVGGLTHYLQVGGWQHPPLVRAPEDWSSVVDGIAIMNSLFRGVHPETGGGGFPSVATRLTQIRDTFEVQGIGANDKFSHFFVLPKGTDETIRFALINSRREPPPLSNFPSRQYTSNWAKTGNYHAGVYDSVFDRQVVVSGGDAPAKVKSSGGSLVGSAWTPAISGWHVWEFSPALTGSEVDWTVEVDGVALAKVRPFRGWFVLHGLGLTEGVCVALTSSQDGARFRAQIASGVVETGRAARSGAYSSTVTVISAAWLALTNDRAVKDGKVYLVIETPGGAIVEYTSIDGETYTMSRTIASAGKYPASCVHGGDQGEGIRFTYWNDGGTIKGDHVDRSGAVIWTGSTNLTGVDTDKGIATLRYPVGTGGAVVVELQAYVSGALTTWTSRDGRTFS